MSAEYEAEFVKRRTVAERLVSAALAGLTKKSNSPGGSAIDRESGASIRFFVDGDGGGEAYSWNATSAGGFALVKALLSPEDGPNEAAHIEQVWIWDDSVLEDVANGMLAAARRGRGK